MANLYERGFWPFTPSGQLKIVDISMFWAAALRCLNGGAELVYNYRLHDAFQGELLHQPAPDGLAFPYPPHMLLLVAPLGLLTYGQAWIAFTLVGMIAYFLVLRKISGDSVSAVGMTLALGGATQTIMLGHNGYFTASLLAGGLVLLPRHKTTAGVLFGMLTFKPHLGIALAAALLLWREWRVIFTAVATTAAMIAITTAVFGPSIWFAFFAGNAQFVAMVGTKQHHLIEPMMQSVLAFAWPHTGFATASVIQAMAALLALACIARVSALTDSWPVRSASVIAGTLLIPPYLFLYDATMLTAAAALLLKGASRREQAGIFLSVLVPGTWYLHLGSQVPIAAFTLLAIAYFRAYRDSTRVSPSAQPVRAENVLQDIQVDRSSG